MPIAAAFLLASPALGAAVSDRHLNATAATVALVLTPVVTAVAMAASSPGDEMAGMLWPGLAGIAGLLLLVPAPSLSSWRTDLGLASLPLVPGIAAAYITTRIRMTRSEQNGSAVGTGFEGTWAPGGYSVQWMERGLLMAAVLFGITFLQGIGSQEIGALGWVGGLADGAILWLTLLTLKRVGAVRWSAQFLLTPLVTILEGLVLLRPMATARSWVGIALLAVSGGYLLVPRSGEERGR